MMLTRISGFAFVLILTVEVALELNAQQTDKPPQSAAPTAPAPASTSTRAATPAPSTVAAPPSPLADALQLYRTGKYEAAIELYNSIIKTNTDTVAASAYAGLARVYLKQKKPADAYTAAAKAVELAPSVATAHSALGEAYFRQGKIAEAEKEFLIPLRANNQDPRAYLGLNHIYLATSNYKLAKTVIGQAHKLDPADPEIRRAWLRTLTFKEQLKTLQEYLSGESNEDPEDRQHLEQMLVVMQDEDSSPLRTCHLKNKVTATQTKLEMLMGSGTRITGYGLNVKVNGTSSKLLLDTGAGGILINSKIAEKAGVKRIVEHEVKGIGSKGPASGYVAHADSITIGELEFENCYVEVVEKKSSLDEDGLIGADVFSHYLVDINFPDAKFKLTELPSVPDQPAEEASLESRKSSNYQPHDRYIAPEMKSYVQIFRFGHCLLIPTAVNELPYKLFLIDTGAFDNTITPEAGREASKLHSDPNLRVKGLSGAVKDVYRADDVTLTFAHFRQQRQGLVSFDLTNFSNSLGTEVSGTLGFAMLRLLDIKIDYRDGLVDFTFDPNRFH
jgi:Flp pilus assembly protein TadD/predicted aspartyl protease